MADYPCHGYERDVTLLSLAYPRVLDRLPEVSQRLLSELGGVG